jgi:predicted RNA-binding protein with RPS1 domain
LQGRVLGAAKDSKEKQSLSIRDLQSEEQNQTRQVSTGMAQAQFYEDPDI